MTRDSPKGLIPDGLYRDQGGNGLIYGLQAFSRLPREWRYLVERLIHSLALLAPRASLKRAFLSTSDACERVANPSVRVS